MIRNIEGAQDFVNENCQCDCEKPRPEAEELYDMIVSSLQDDGYRLFEDADDVMEFLQDNHDIAEEVYERLDDWFRSDEDLTDQMVDLARENDAIENDPDAKRFDND